MSRRPSHPLAQVRAGRTADEALLERLRVIEYERRLRRDQAIVLHMEARDALIDAERGVADAKDVEALIRRAEQTI